MSKKDEALKLALEALERYQVKRQDFDRFADEITALREALAERPAQQQEEKPTTREDIIRMAREAGVFETRYNPVVYSATPEALERFAALVAAAEREALEKIDWTVLLRQGGLVTWGDAATLADRVIAAIRARGNT